MDYYRLRMYVRKDMILDTAVSAWLVALERNQGRPGSGKSSALFHLKTGETLLTPTPGSEGFYVERATHAGTKLNVWEVQPSSTLVREKSWTVARALVFVVDSTEDIQEGESGGAHAIRKQYAFKRNSLDYCRAPRLTLHLSRSFLVATLKKR